MRKEKNKEREQSIQKKKKIKKNKEQRIKMNNLSLSQRMCRIQNDFRYLVFHSMTLL